METRNKTAKPRRITDLVDAKNAGADVSLSAVFDIVPVDFHHGKKPFQAYIFLVNYRGRIGDEGFDFRKCYARGCPHNLCTHVSQAVRIANRYLERDCQVLENAGIETPIIRFALDDMVVKFESAKGRDRQSMTIPEIIGLAKSGNVPSVALDLDYWPAVEHFANHKNAQTFLSGEFTATAGKDIYHCHRCFSCYPTGEEYSEKPLAVKVANARLKLIFSAFKTSGITFSEKYFE